MSLLRAADVLNDLPAALHTLLQQAADQLTGSTPFYSWNKNIFFAKILHFVEFASKNYFSVTKFKRSRTRDFKLQVFLMNQFLPGPPRASQKDLIEFARKFAEIFANECKPAVSGTPAIKEENF